MSVVELNDKTFEEKIKANCVLVDCYAPWCGPCKMISPIIDKISEEVKDCQFYKLNVDENEDTVSKYGIMSIPTLLYFEGGNLISKNVGFRDKNGILEIIKKR